MTTRKNSSQLSPIEKQRFISVLTQLITAPGDPNAYGNHVAIHRDHMKYMMHPQMGPEGVQRFLPWHRVYLMKTEAMGQAIDPAFFIPYWDWTTERKVPDWMGNFLPTVRTPAPTIHVTRHPGPGSQLPTAALINGIVANNHTHTAFTNAIDVPHGRVHNWASGTLSDFSNSPGDPLFWMHHSNIDRIWAGWQVANPGQNSNPSANWRVLTPWAETVDQVRNIATLNYRYA